MVSSHFKQAFKFVLNSLEVTYKPMQKKETPSIHQEHQLDRNLVEHAPLMIILLMLMEYRGSEFFVHLFGIGFVLCRGSHAYGIIARDGLGPDNIPRAVGAIGSWSLMILASLMCIF